jgi:hypothetical protein
MKTPPRLQEQIHSEKKKIIGAKPLVESDVQMKKTLQKLTCEGA